MSDELEIIYKEAVVVIMRQYPVIFMEGLRKTRKPTLRIVNVPTRIGNDHFQN
jgi:hypothetical protein